MSNHASHGPSRAGRDIVCAAAASREALLPDTSSAAAEWGTDSHWILEEALNTSVEPLELKMPEIPPYPDWCEVDWRDKATCAQVAYLYAQGIKLQNKQCEILAETKVFPGRWIGVEDDIWGTADITIITNEVMEVVDFKSGRIHVDAGGPQNKLYLLGKALEYTMPHEGEVFPFAILRSTIVQPRGEDPQHVRSVDYTLQELYDWMISVYKPAYEASIGLNPIATPSTEGCRWCRAKAGCRELAEQALASVTQIRQPISDVIRIPDGDTLTKQEKRMILDGFPMMEAFYKAIREEAIHDIEAGVGFPGYKMVAGRNNKSWVTADEDKLRKLFKNRKIPIDTYAPRVTASPAALLKATSVKHKESIEKLITIRKGRPRLVPDTNPAPQVNLSGGNAFGITDLDPSKETEAAAPAIETTAVPNCLL